MIKTTNTIFLKTKTACAIWEHEIKGQLSDGMWENTSPLNHWKFWSNTDAVHDELAENHVLYERTAEEIKNNYNLKKLVPYIGDRMILIAKLALSGIEPSWANQSLFENDQDIQNVSYTKKDLFKDLEHIKEAMKTLKRVEFTYAY